MDLKKIWKHPLVWIVLFGLAIRLYYFIITYNQPLWWDEAVYMIMARHWTAGLFYDFTPARPILFSLIISLFNFVSTSELLPRLFILIFSLSAIVGMYYLARCLTDSKRAGLLSAFLTSIFYIHIFYTSRLLVDTLSFTFFIWSAFFFFKYYKKNNPKFAYIASAIVGIGFLFRITTALILGVVFIYALVTGGFKEFKKKEYWIGALIFLLIITPYLIWGYFQFEGFVLTKAFATNAPKNFWVGGYNVLIDYILRLFLLLPNHWAFPLLGLFICGLFMTHDSIVGFDMMRKGDEELKRKFFILLMFLIPLIAISFLLDHYEDRYIFNVFPAIFILTSIAAVYFQELISKRYNKNIGAIFITILFALILYSQLQAVDFTVVGKLQSYQQVKDAGLWIKENSNPEDIVITHSYPQTQYYSWRYCRHFPKTKEEFESLDQTNFTYFVLSVFERSPEWVYSYPQEKNLTVANAWVTEKQEPILVIYNLK
jgi:4-amino-4-deoxy-L-arabinose transferase-like glycosyltransferase